MSWGSSQVEEPTGIRNVPYSCMVEETGSESMS